MKAPPRHRGAPARQPVAAVAARAVPVAPQEPRPSACGEAFLGDLAGFPPRTFEKGFSRIATRLGLGAALTGDELRSLYEAAFLSCLSNIAFNRLDGCLGATLAARESTRVALEQDFMATRDRLFACPGWQRLSSSNRGEVERILLSIRVDDENLAPEL